MTNLSTISSRSFVASVHDSEHQHVLHVTGELDLAVVPLLSPFVVELLSQEQPFVVDASAVTFVDASGLRALLGGYQPCALTNLRFRAASPPVLRLLELVGMQHLVTNAG